MFERAYRQRLETDLTRWEAEGLLTPANGAAIRGALPPVPAGINIATVVAIVGGLLIAAAFLAFVAANWTDIPRPMRFAILVAGIVAAHGIGAFFAQTGRTVLADLAACVGAIVFGAAIALVGQMYHLAADFAGGLLLWTIGALMSAVVTGSSGALAVALAAGSIWSGGRVFEASGAPHLPFIPVWLVATGLSLAWNSVAARHMVAVAALAWWGVAQVSSLDNRLIDDVPATFGAGAILMLGAGLALGRLRDDALRAFGLTL